MMKNQSGIKWFVRGFVATLFIVMLTFYVSVGQTQEGDPLAESNLGSSSDESSSTSTGRTDDPLGRIFISLAEDPLPSSNLDSTMLEMNEDISTMSETAVQLEEQLLADAYVSPLVIPAADFTPDGGNPDSVFFTFGGGYFQGDSQNYGCMVAPVYLPQGATVEEMYVSVYDNDTTFNFFVDLRRVDNFAGGTNIMASAATSGDFDGLQTISDTSVDNPLVAYPDYSYYVTTCVLSGNIRLYSVRLYYTS